MSQLMMCKTMAEGVFPYPLHEDYYIRNFRETEDEIAAWIEICKNGLFGPDAGREGYVSSITNVAGVVPERDIFFVCERKTDRPVATITGFVRPDGAGDIHMVAAIPEVRDKKIGHAMLAHALEKLSRDGVEKVYLTTDEWRKPAIKNYLTAGFCPVEYDVGMPERWVGVFAEMGLEPVPLQKL